LVATATAFVTAGLAAAFDGETLVQLDGIKLAKIIVMTVAICAVPMPALKQKPGHSLPAAIEAQNQKSVSKKWENCLKFNPLGRRSVCSCHP
jgi:hypothetical protein